MRVRKQKKERQGRRRTITAMRKWKWRKSEGYDFHTFPSKSKKQFELLREEVERGTLLSPNKNSFELEFLEMN
jgi:hypothetical protein